MSPRRAVRAAPRRPAPRPAPAPSVSAVPPIALVPRSRADWADLAILAALVFAWWGGTTRLALHQDDFLLAGEWHGPWRVLFVSALHVLWRGAQATAWPYHALVLTLHVAAAWLAGRLARGFGAGRMSAMVASALFAVSATHAYSLYNIASAADIAAALGVLVAVVAIRAGRDGWAAVAFLGALACKETVAALPLAFLLLPSAPGAPRRRVPWVLLALSATWLGVLYVTGHWVTQQFAHLYIGASPGEALRQFLGYVSATADWWGTRVDAYRNVANPSPWYLLLVAATWIACLRPPRLRAITLFTTAWFVCAIAPVTTTRSMFVLYYLYIPLAGTVVGVACALTHFRAPALAAASAGVMLAAGSATTLGRLESARLPGTEVHAQSSLRHAQIAGATVGDLTGVPLGEAVAVWMPRRYPRSAWRNHGWYGQNVRSALSDGRALVLVCPQVRTVSFPSVDDPYPGRAVVAMGWDGHVRAITPFAP